MEKLIPKEMQDTIDKMHIKCAVYRGTFVHHFTDLESQMEDLISIYFCNDNQKRVELIHALVSTKNLDCSAKISLLKFIVKNNFPDFLNLNKTFFSELQTLMEERNIVAHGKFLCTEDRINNFDGISVFIDTFKTDKSKTVTVPFELNENIMKEKIKLILATKKKVEDLKNRILNTNNN